MFDISDLLTGLAESRKVFHSEADFQHALAWQIHQVMRRVKSGWRSMLSRSNIGGCIWTSGFRWRGSPLS